LNRGLKIRVWLVQFRPWPPFTTDRTFDPCRGLFAGLHGSIIAASRTFITYDDPQSLATKADYVREHHLGGMLFWELSQDYDDELLDVIVRGMRR